jgi:cytochrome c2
MSGMPAWETHLDDDDIWALVALVEQLPTLSPAAYAALQEGPAVAPQRPAAAVSDPPASVSAERGRTTLTQYGCQSCHVIPGIIGSSVQVGPQLDHYAQRRYVAGYLPNTPANLARWLRYPQQVKPHTAMPQLGLSQRDADDIAAYLLSAD